MTGAPRRDDEVPVSVRLGEVVPPEDPEDWSRPLTWLAALGMLAGPIAVLAWFLVAPPARAIEEEPVALAAAAVLAAGAAITGATQLGTSRAWTATVASALFAALVVVILGVVFASERQVGSASPTVSHAVATAVGGLAGAAVAAALAAPLAALRSRPLRAVPAAIVGAAVGAFTTGALFMSPAGP